MADKTIYIDSDNDVFWPAKRHDTDALLTTGTVTMSLLDSAGASVSLASSAMAYSSTRGGWVGTIDEAADLTEDALYTLVLVGDWSGPDNKRKISCVAKYQGVR